MNKKFTKHLSLLLLVVILLSSVPSFAATFPDVKSSHWAYEYIEKMVKQGVIKGHDDGTFKPSDSVTYLENLQMISGIITMSKEELNEGKMAYNSLVNELKIASWAQEAVIKCLYKDVISESELRQAHKSGLTTTGTKYRPARLAISVYLAKAMGLEELAYSKTVIVLPYKDSLQIEAKHHRFLLVLIEAGVLDPKGTGEGFFEPKSPVKRDAIAKMMSTAYDYVQKNPVKPVEKEEVSIRGTVVSVLSDSKQSYVTVKDRDNNQKAYAVDSKTVITVDNKTGKATDIVEGQDIDLTIIKDQILALTVNVTSIEEDFKGTVKSIIPSANKLTIEYEDTKSKTKKTLELSVDKNASIYLNDKKADLYDIKVGDSVELIVRNKVVLDIEAKSKSRKIEGHIAAITENNKQYTITIEDDKGVKSDYELSEKAYIYRNNKSAKIVELRIGDKAYIELEYNVILDIEAEIVRKEIEGYIIGINRVINKSAEITIKDRKTDKEETYVIAPSAYIKIDNLVVTSWDLREGYFVDVVVGGNEIIEIYADSVSSESMIRGKVLYVNPRSDELEIEVTSSDLDIIKYGDEVLIRTVKDVAISDGKYINLILSDVKKGMNVVIFGTYDGARFIASEISIR